MIVEAPNNPCGFSIHLPSFQNYQIAEQEKPHAKMLLTSLNAMQSQLEQTCDGMKLYEHVNDLSKIIGKEHLKIRSLPKECADRADQLRKVTNELVMHHSWKVCAARSIAITAYEIFCLLDLISKKHFAEMPEFRKTYVDNTIFKSAHKKFKATVSENGAFRKIMAHPGTNRTDKNSSFVPQTGIWIDPDTKEDIVAFIHGRDDLLEMKVSPELIDNLRDVIVTAYSAFKVVRADGSNSR